MRAGKLFCTFDGRAPADEHQWYNTRIYHSCFQEVRPRHCVRRGGRRQMREKIRPIITSILSAGASRDVSYATGLTRSANDPGPSMPSPLDSDFFDLLQRLEARTEPGEARDSMCRIIKNAVNYKGEPLWQSMEKMFYACMCAPYWTIRYSTLPKAITPAMSWSRTSWPPSATC